jgi:hypothetical protein
MLKDPEDFNPSFRPNTMLSQSIVPGRTSGEMQGFQNFLEDINTWKMRKDKKLSLLVEEKQKQERKIYTYRPSIN